MTSTGQNSSYCEVTYFSSSSIFLSLLAISPEFCLVLLFMSSFVSRISSFNFRISLSNRETSNFLLLNSDETNSFSFVLYKNDTQFLLVTHQSRSRN